MQQTITTNKASILAVLLPEGSCGIDLENGFLFYDIPNKTLEQSVKLPSGNWFLLEKLKQ